MNSQKLASGRPRVTWSNSGKNVQLNKNKIWSSSSGSGSDSSSCSTGSSSSGGGGSSSTVVVVVVNSTVKVKGVYSS